MSGTTIFWLLLTVVLIIIEAATPMLVCIWSAIGALAACVIAALGTPLWLQIVIFVAISVVLIILTRPLAKKYVTKKAIATNADRVIGAEGIVIQKIDSIENSGQIKVLGQVWSAKSENGEIVETGAHVTITALEGVKAIVKTK